MTITIRIGAEPGDGKEGARPVPADEQRAEGGAGEVVVVEIPVAGDPFTAARLGDS